MGGSGGPYPDIDLVLKDLGLVEYTHSLHSIHRVRGQYTHTGVIVHLSLYKSRQWNSVRAMPTGVLVSESLQYGIRLFSTNKLSPGL